MNIISIVLVLFIVLESSNVLLLYFFPESKKGNGVGIFKALEKSKSNPEVYALIKYLINWVAGTKLIFIALLAVIIAVGNKATQLYSLVALIISVATFFWRLYPLIKAMDANNEIAPKGYSKTLAIMIAAFIAVFTLALVIHLYYFN
jgi:hypothetical protein